MKKPVVTLITAAKLTAQQKKVVVEALETKIGSFEIEEVVDSSLMGGIKIKLGTQEFDASLSGRLERLEKVVPEVVVTTVVELTDAQRKKIKDAVEQKLGASALKEIIDPSIIGGIKIIIGSKELDATVRGRLERLKRELMQTI